MDKIAKDEEVAPSDDELVAFFADNYVATSVPAALKAVALNDEDEREPVPVLSDAWRGGGGLPGG